MRLFTAALVGTLHITGCGGADAYDPSGDTELLGSVGHRSYEPQGPQEIVLVESEADQALGKVDALRCYLLHREEARSRKGLSTWEQPPMSDYEKSTDPCSLLPGFVDTEKAKRTEHAHIPIR